MLSIQISQSQIQKKPQDISFIQSKYPTKLALQLIKTLRIVWSFRNRKSIYFSQSYVGKKLKVGRTYALKLLHILNDEGFIGIYGRQSKTSEYEINPFYLQPEEQHKLNRFFKYGALLSLSFISSISAASRFVTQLFSQGIAPYKNSIKESYVFPMNVMLLLKFSCLFNLKKFKKTTTTAGGAGTFEAESMAPEQTVHYGGTPLRSLEPEPINETTEEYVQFEAQFLSEMPEPCCLSLRSSCSN